MDSENWENADDQGRSWNHFCHMLLCRNSRKASNDTFSGALPRLIVHDNGCPVFFQGGLEWFCRPHVAWWPELEKVPSWTSGSRRGTPAVITQEARPSLALAAPAVLLGGDLYRSPEGLPSARRVTIPDYRAFSYRLERRLDFSFHLAHWEILQDGASECLCGVLWAWPFAPCPRGNA